MFDKQDYLKVTNAAYRLIDYFPEGDPLKNTTKQKALAVLEGATLAVDESHFLQITRDIEILKNYFSLARYQGWVSDMNFFIITKEYDQMAFSLAHKLPKNNGSVFPVTPEQKIQPENEVTEQAVESLVAQLPKKEIAKPAVTLPKRRPPKTIVSVSGKATERHHKILDILKNNPKTQVGDIIKHLPNITKRTIRRDLDLLLKEGRVQRLGEWNQVFYEIA